MSLTKEQKQRALEASAAFMDGKPIANFDTIWLAAVEWALSELVPQLKEEVAWLIEDTSLPCTRYWTGHGVDTWDVDVNSAMRFSRKQDAETALGWIVPPRHSTRIAEHIWINGGQPQ